MLLDVFAILFLKLSVILIFGDLWPENHSAQSVKLPALSQRKGRGFVFCYGGWQPLIILSRSTLETERFLIWFLILAGAVQRMDPLTNLQVAVKNSVDIFYFSCTVPYHVFFVEDGQMGNHLLCWSIFFIWRQRGRVASALDTQSRFELRSDRYMDLIHCSPEFKSTNTPGLPTASWDSCQYYVQFELFVLVVTFARSL